MESIGKFDFSRTMKSPWMSLHVLVASSLWEGPTTHNTPSVCWGGSFSPTCFQDCCVCWQGALGPSLSPKLGHDPDRLRQRQRAASALQAPAKVGDGFPAGFSVYVKLHLSSGSIPVGFAIGRDVCQRQVSPGDMGSGRLLMCCH